MGPIVRDTPVILYDPRLNRSREISSETVGGGIFNHYSNFHKCLPEVAGEVISGVAVELVGADASAKCGDSRLNSGRAIQLFARPDPFYALLYSV